MGSDDREVNRVFDILNYTVKIKGVCYLYIKFDPFRRVINREVNYYDCCCLASQET